MRPCARLVRGWASGLVGALAVISLLRPGPAHAGTLHIAIEALPCPSRDEIAQDIARRVADLMAGQPDLALLIATPTPQELTLRLVGTTPTWERTVAFSRDDCPVLPPTIAFLLRSWLSRPLIAVAASAGEAPEVEAPEPPAESPPAPRSPARARVSALAGLFQSFGADGAAPTLSLSAEYSLVGPVGLALTGTWDTAVHARYGSGSTSASIPMVGLAGRFTPRATESLALDLLAGPALAFIDYQPRGYPELERPRLKTDFAFTAAARLRVRLADPVWWTTSAELAFRRYRETFVVDGNRSVLSLDPTRIRVLTGLTFEAF